MMRLMQGPTSAYAAELTGDHSVESLADFAAYLLDRLPSSVAAAHRSARDLVTPGDGVPGRDADVGRRRPVGVEHPRSRPTCLASPFSGWGCAASPPLA
jgi:hypothetical protein